jgi:hypothetical protein
MLSQEEYMDLLALKRRGLTNREIAEESGITRRRSRSGSLQGAPSAWLHPHIQGHEPPTSPARFSGGGPQLGRLTNRK